MMKNKLPEVLRNMLQKNEKIISILKALNGTNKYLVTNKRIIDYKSLKNIRSIEFSRIYGVKLGFEIPRNPSFSYTNSGSLSMLSLPSNSIVLLLQPGMDNISADEWESHKVFVMVAYYNNIRDTKKIIKNAWFKESPYMLSIRPLKQLAEKHGLQMAPITLETSQNVRITGQIGEMDVSFLLSDVYQFNRLNINIKCPNPEDNYFYVRPETFSDGFRKLFGKQDILVKDKEFNRNFLLQSDNQHFFDFIMEDYIQNMIADAWKWVKGEVKFGEEKKKDKKSSKKESIDLLDDHLISEIIPPTEYNAEKTDVLSYECRGLRETLRNTGVIIAECIQNFETTLAIAKRIQEYYDNKNTQ